MHDLIGRDEVLTEIDTTLQSHPLVTIVGPGGVGKTSVARALVADEPHVFAELSSITTDDDLPKRVAQRAGFIGIDELVEWLSGSRATLVLDTCEHLVDGIADLTATLLQRVEHPRILVTSRVPLDLPDEFVHVLRTLPTANDADGAALSPAGELFLQRARRSGAPLDEGTDIGAVERLCARLDGLPLAIELAAARSRMMSPDEVLEHLEDGVDVLRRPKYRGESRHRSLRAAIDWSYRLLDPEGKRLFQHLAVFPGWFDAALATAVLGDESGEPLHDTLADLVDHSLVRADVATDGASRFALFDSTRAYAEEQLHEAGSAEKAREAYVDAMCARAALYLSIDEGDWGAHSFRSLIGLVDDLIHATRLALDDTSPDRAFGLMLILWGVVPHARSAEVADLGLLVLDRWPEPDLPLRSDVVATTATAMREIGKHREALALANDALDHINTGLFAAVSLPRILALLLRGTDPTSARQHAEAATEAATNAGLAPFAREMRLFIAQLEAEVGDPAQARDDARRITCETTSDDLNHMFGLLVEGMAQLKTEPEAAIDTLQRAHHLSEANGYIFGVGASLRLLALREHQLGHHQASAAIVLQLLAHVQASRNLGEQGTTLRLGVAVIRAIDTSAANRVIQLARGWSQHDVLAEGSLEDLAVPDTNVGRTIAPSRALAACREALESIVTTATVTTATVPAAASESPNTIESAGRTTSGALLQRSGDTWAASFASKTVTLRHSKGLSDIATLLALPGSDVHVFDLADVAVVDTSSDTVLDAAAMKAYRHRIRDLQEDLAEADDMGDIARSERAQWELDSLVEQLTAASGLGGRSRRMSGAAERARTTVTKRIRLTIKKITTMHPELGRHLDLSISTGVFCRYDPELPVEWTL